VQGVVQPVLADLALECACADTQHSGRLLTTSVEQLECSTRLRDWSNLCSKGAHVIRSTHRARHAGGSNGSAKYCVSRTTLPAWNSIMLTVLKGRPS
jgi:hypothetical protein